MTPADSTIRVLLVDDHPLLRDGVRMRLHVTPHIRVIGEAGNAYEAAQLTERMRPDIVLTDIRMPDANGIQMARAFRDRFPATRVLILSMHHDAEYVERAIAFGVRGYVLKDGPSQQLVEAVDEVHRGGRYFSPELAVPDDEDMPPEVTRASHQLTPREAAVLSLLAEGHSNKEIAHALGASVRTVETHRLHLRRKLRIDGQAALVKYAVAYADLQGGA